MKNKILFLSLLIILLNSISCDKLEVPLPPASIDLIPSFGRTISSIDIFWIEYEGDDFERYEIYIKDSTTQNFRLYTTISNIRQVYTSISDLSPNTYYDYFVRLVLKSGTYKDTKISTVKTFDDQPSPVQIYAITDITHHSVKLIWSSYKDDYAVDFSRYEIHYSNQQNFTISEKTLFTSIRKIMDSSWQVTNLSDRKFYYFKIRTYNALEKFKESQEVRAIILNAPPFPVNLNLPDEVTENSVKVSWSPSIDTDFMRYDIHISKNMHFAPSHLTLVSQMINRKDTSYKITNLIKDYEYFIKVLVYDNLLVFSESNEIGITTTQDGGPVPVVLYEPSLIGRRSVSLSWSQSVSRYFKAYYIYKSTTPNFNIDPRNWTGTIENRTKTDTIIELQPNTTYYFKVQVQNQMGRFSVSNEKSITTLP